MRKVTSYKCPECGMAYKSLSGWGNHMERTHPDTIPEGWSNARYFYYVLTGRSEGRCIQCHNPTDWNEATAKYARYCNNPKCKQEYVKVAKKRMIDKYGKPHLLDDPEKQREMLKSKKISGEYKFSDGGKLSYVGSYERDFLMTCDIVLGLSSKDIMAPSPHNYVYMYEGKPHIYIPDFFIPDFNLEIEVKDGGDNPNKHHKIQEVDKVKERLKDQAMITNPSVNYFKVVNKKYDDFFDFMLNCKNAIDDDKLKQVQSKIVEANELKASMEAANESSANYTPEFYMRMAAQKEASDFRNDFNKIAGPMLDKQIEMSFKKYEEYEAFSHSYRYPYGWRIGTLRIDDPYFKGNTTLTVEIPMMIIETKRPFIYIADKRFDDRKILEVLREFERNLDHTIKLDKLYKKYPDATEPFVEWEGSMWILKCRYMYHAKGVPLALSMKMSNESAEDDYFDDVFEFNF